jgi:hypothetical protein
MTCARGEGGGGGTERAAWAGGRPVCGARQRRRRPQACGAALVWAGWASLPLAAAPRPPSAGASTRRRRAAPHLPAAALALRGALDDTRQVQQLDLGVVVVDDAGDACEGGELVRRGLRLCACQLGQQRRLADRGEACGQGGAWAGGAAPAAGCAAGREGCGRAAAPAAKGVLLLLGPLLGLPAAAAAAAGCGCWAAEPRPLVRWERRRGGSGDSRRPPVPRRARGSSPMSATRPSPYFCTSKPSPPAPLDAGVCSSVLSLANRAFSWPRWYSVACAASARGECSRMGAPCGAMPRSASAAARSMQARQLVRPSRRPAGAHRTLFF